MRAQATRAMLVPSLLAIAIALAAAPAFAQEYEYVVEPVEAMPVGEAAFSQEQLDQMLAPVALYPDALLSQILVAATYPLEIVEAARWSRANPQLEGEEAVEAVAGMNWDPSVKALVAFPEILQRMDEDLEWTRSLGDAMLSQESQVMDSVQFLRARADAAGHLADNEYTRVIREERTIIIEPARPHIVHVPYYDPWVVYGSWWWPAYPPVVWALPSYYYYGYPGFWFGHGVRLSAGFFYTNFYWPSRSLVVVHAPLYYRVPYYRAHARHYVPGQKWRHNPVHRRGVAYRHDDVRQRFGDFRHSSPTRWRDDTRIARSGGGERRWDGDRQRSESWREGDRQRNESWRDGDRQRSESWRDGSSQRVNGRHDGVATRQPSGSGNTAAQRPRSDAATVMQRLQGNTRSAPATADRREQAARPTSRFQTQPQAATREAAARPSSSQRPASTLGASRPTTARTASRLSEGTRISQRPGEARVETRGQGRSAAPSATSRSAAPVATSRSAAPPPASARASRAPASGTPPAAGQAQSRSRPAESAAPAASQPRARSRGAEQRESSGSGRDNRRFR